MTEDQEAAFRTAAEQARALRKQLKEFTDKLEGQEKITARLEKQTRRNRKVNVFLAVGIIANGLFFWGMHNLQVNNCDSGNRGREVQRALWGYIIDTNTHSPKITPEQKKGIEQFREWEESGFAERDCSQIGWWPWDKGPQDEPMPPRPPLLKAE